MADTIRTKTALLSLLADNTAGDISTQDVRDMLVSVFGVYGSIYLKDGSTAQTSIGTTPAKMTGFAADGVSAGTTPDHTNDQITVGTDGVYAIFFQNSFSGTVSADFTFFIRIGGAESIYGVRRKLGTGGDVGSVSMLGLLSLSASDVITVYVEAVSDGREMTPIQAQLLVIKIA